MSWTIRSTTTHDNLTCKLPALSRSTSVFFFLILSFLIRPHPRRSETLEKFIPYDGGFSTFLNWTGVVSEGGVLRLPTTPGPCARLKSGDGSRANHHYPCG